MIWMRHDAVAVLCVRELEVVIVASNQGPGHIIVFGDVASLTEQARGIAKQV